MFGAKLNSKKNTKQYTAHIAFRETFSIYPLYIFVEDNFKPNLSHRK